MYCKFFKWMTICSKSVNSKRTLLYVFCLTRSVLLAFIIRTNFKVYRLSDMIICDKSLSYLWQQFVLVFRTCFRVFDTLLYLYEHRFCISYQSIVCYRFRRKKTLYNICIVLQYLFRNIILHDKHFKKLSFIFLYCS